jgi:hypothetical protein
MQTLSFLKTVFLLRAFCGLGGKNLSYKDTENTKATLKKAMYKNMKIYFLGYKASCETVDREIIGLYELILI